jgi:hypothetical protein
MAFEPMEDGRMGKKKHNPEIPRQNCRLYNYFNKISVILFIVIGAPI